MLSRWLWSYAIVLLIPIIVMAVTHLQTQRVIEDEISKANSALLSQLQQEIDNYIDYTYRLSEVISLNPKVSSLIRSQKEIGTAERISIVQLLAEFKAYNITKRYVSGFYIYFHEGDFVLTDSSYYETDMFVQQHLSPMGVSLEQWRGYLMQMHKGSFSTLREFGGERKGTIMQTQSLPLQLGSVPLATLAIELNEEQLMSSISNIQSYNQGNVYIP
jgi:hypothetical protein